MSGVEAAIHCGDELWFGVGMEVSERDQNLALNTGRNGPGAHLESVMIFLEAAAFPSPAFLFFCPRGMMNFNYRLLSKIYQNFYQSDPFSSVVKSGMPLNQL